MLETRIADILVKLVAQESLTEEERAELGHWRVKSSENEAFLRTVTSDESIIGDLKVFMGMKKAALLQKIEAGLQEPVSEPDPVPVPVQKSLIRRLLPYVAAAVVIGCLILSYLLKAPGKENLTAASPTGGHIDPFYQKAPDSGSVKLTLGDGAVMNLDTVQERLTITQGTVLASVDDGRLLQYASDRRQRVLPGEEKVMSGEGTAGIIYNTLLVPYGNRYRLQLPDGTKVILNAGSSIRYPIAFTGDERKVEVTGEVFFNVAKDQTHPFVVKTKRQRVEVLGTSFAVADYPNEIHSKVVVETGKVSLSTEKGTPTILTASQQANVGEDGNVAVQSGVNLRSELAWKEEYFNFDGLDIKAALWQLAQSYNMRILFDDNIKGGTLGSGNIQRDLPLERLLKDLELPDLHFEIHMRDNTIVVKR